ncbi:MAG: TM2 domain-containing protein [Rubrivivax sp.]
MPAPPEDRRLKVAGLLLLALAGAALAALAGAVAARWPISTGDWPPLLGLTIGAANLLAGGLLVLAAGCGAQRAWRDPSRRRALAWQLLVANLLVPIVLYTLLTSDERIDAELRDSDWDMALSIGLALCAVLAWRVWRRARRHEALSADEAMARDPRPPVLYLRSFQDDGVALLAQTGSRWARTVAAAVQAPTPEERLARVLADIGPLIAIGKPGEPLPELGAARLYVGHADWQAEVQRLLQRAALVVVRVGASPGVRWEIEQALAALPRSRLVFATLGQTALAPEIHGRLAPVLGLALPAMLTQVDAPTGWQVLWRQPHRRLGALVWFDAEGRPQVEPVVYGFRRFADLRHVETWLRMVDPLGTPVRRVLAGLGLAAPGSARRSRPLAIALALLFGYAGAHWFYLGQPRLGKRYLLLMPLALASLFMAFYDALRFVWADRADFDRRFVALGAPRLHEREGPDHVSQ